MEMGSAGPFPVNMAPKFALLPTKSPLIFFEFAARESRLGLLFKCGLWLCAHVQYVHRRTFTVVMISQI